MLQLNGERLIVVYGGDAWEIENSTYDWHLIRHAITISMPKTRQLETFAEFQERLKRMDKEREDTDESN